MFDHTPEWKEKQANWRARHLVISAPILHELGMRIKNGPNTDYQIARATGLSQSTIKKLREFNHGGMPYYSTIAVLSDFFQLDKKR